VSSDDIDALGPYMDGERAAEGAGHLYVVYPDGAGRSRLTAASIDRALSTTVTARNWNTVMKIQAALTALALASDDAGSR